MPRHQHEDEDDADAQDEQARLDDRDLPNESDMDSFDEPGLDACPYCRKLISEDAEICPHCRNYLSKEDAPTRQPVWILIAGAITILAILIAWVIKGR